MDPYGFSPDLISDIELTFQELFVISNALLHAREYIDEHLSNNVLSNEMHSRLSDKLEAYKLLADYIDRYLEDYGFSIREI